MSSIPNLVSLGDIADIRTGYTFREGVNEVPLNSQADAHVVQIKDVRNTWEITNTPLIQAQQLPLIRWEGSNKAFASPGSVLLPARGAKGGYFRASYLSSDQQGQLPVVVSSQLLIITTKQGVLPEFLCWSLNRPAMQYWLSKGAGSQGTNIVMLNTKVAKELKLEIPTLATQEKILYLNKLWEQEQQLTQALLKNRETMLQGMFQNLLKEKKQ
jgi:restriction endonuclease S subunit